MTSVRIIHAISTCEAHHQYRELKLCNTTVPIDHIMTVFTVDNFSLGGIFRAKRHFSLENVTSMRSSLLVCVKFPQNRGTKKLRTVQLFSVVELLRKLKHGGLLLGVAVGLICHWIPANGGSGTSKYNCEKYEGSPVHFSLKETSLKRRNKCEIHWQTECHH